ARRVPDHVMTVGVFRNQPLREVRSLLDTTGLRAVQLHGREDLTYYDALRTGGWTLIRGTGFREPLPRHGEMGEDILLIDAPAPGSGHSWDWSRKSLGPEEKWLLAGGLTPGNVGDAVRVARPWGVDV